MAPFLTTEALIRLWVGSLRKLAPRLQYVSESKLVRGDVKEDVGLDSLEIMELGAQFHGMFHLLSGPLDTYLLQYQRAEQWLESILYGANDLMRPLSFFTSGSTGVPKQITHQKQGLLKEVQFWKGYFQDTSRIWGWVPPQHMYGFLFTVLLPGHSQLSLVEPEKQDLTNLRQEAKDGDILIGFPDLYRQWRKAGTQFPSRLHGLSSTAPLDTETAHWITQTGSLTEIYGSTETGGMGYRNRLEEAFRLLPYWQKSATGTVFKHGNPVEEMDFLEWKNDREFWVQGRKDKGVQVGGENVFPEKVAARMAKIPGIRAAWVRKMKANEGNRLKAWIQAEPEYKDLPQLEASCYQWIEQHLGAPERPRHLRVHHHAPLNALGKAQDWSISSQAY